jgi:hypothetical protein
VSTPELKDRLEKALKDLESIGTVLGVFSQTLATHTKTLAEALKDLQ